MNPALGIVGGLVLGAVIGFGSATVYQKRGGAMPTVGGAAAANATLFELDGVKYASNDLPPDVRNAVFEVGDEAHTRTDALLNQYALQLALAKEKGIAVKPGVKLPPFDELLSVAPPTDDELKALYDSNKERLPPDTSFETIKGEIERYVKNQKINEALRAKSEEFKTKNGFKLLTTGPEAPKVELNVAAFASKGPATAPHTLVEVADYLCPHCQAVQPEVEAALKEAGDKLKLVAIPYSLRPDSLSGALARGAFCAKQQSEELFWKYHNTAFTTAQTKGWKATDAEAKEPVLEVAKAAGLDEAKLDTCLASDEAKAFVTNTGAAMTEAGVSGTPTFFLNNRRLQLRAGLKDAVLGQLKGGASH